MEAQMSSQEARRTLKHQPSLFRPHSPKLELPQPVRASVLPLLQRLLQEVMWGVDNTVAGEIGNDKNNV
jgi:hypothetical protein